MQKYIFKISLFFAFNFIYNSVIAFAQKANLATNSAKLAKSTYDVVQNFTKISPNISQEIVIRIPPQVSFMISTLGFGGIAGLCVGYTLKKFAKIVAIIVGILFIVLQLLAYLHFITVNWEYINSIIAPAGFQTLWVSFISVITYNFPFAGAFITGLYIGFNKG